MWQRSVRSFREWKTWRNVEQLLLYLSRLIPDLMLRSTSYESSLKQKQIHVIVTLIALIPGQNIQSFFLKNTFWRHRLNSWLATTGKTCWTMGNISKTAEQSGTLKLHLERLWNALWHQWEGVTWNKRGLPCLERSLCFPIDSSCWWRQQVWDPVRGRQERVSMVHHVRHTMVIFTCGNIEELNNTISYNC